MKAEQYLDISDSPQINLAVIPAIQEMEISRSYQINFSQNVSSKAKSQKTKTTPRKIEDKPPKSRPLILRNVDGLIPQELYQFSNKQITVEEIQLHLRQLEQVQPLWNQTIRRLQKTNPLFQNYPNFQAFDRSLQQQNKQEGEKNINRVQIKSQMIDYSYESVQQSDQLSKLLMIQQSNNNNNPEELTFECKLKILKLKKYCSVLKRKILKFVEQKRSKQSANHFHVCKHCGASFSSGRQLGGHMSRRHNGESKVYKHKTEIHKINKQQRNRRKLIRKANPKPIKLQEVNNSEDNSAQFLNEISVAKSQILKLQEFQQSVHS